VATDEVGELAELAAAVGVGLAGVDELMHPAIDNEATTTSMIVTNSFFSIQVPLDGKMNQKRTTVV
jgi:hypothetical protein